MLVCNGTKYDGQFLREPFITRLWPIESTAYATVLAVDVLFFDSCIDGSTRLETRLSLAQSVPRWAMRNEYNYVRNLNHDRLKVTLKELLDEKFSTERYIQNENEWY